MKIKNIDNHNYLEFKTTSWYYKRFILMILVFIGFGLYFFYDGNISYPKKMQKYKKYNQIQKIHKKFSTTYTSTLDTIKWKTLVSKNKWENFFINPQNLLNKTPNEIWTQYTKEKMWSDKIPTEYTQKDLDEQIFFGYLCVSIGILILLYFILNVNNTIGVDSDSAHFTNGDIVPFKNITKINKTKWENKGLAKIYYTKRNKKNIKTTLDCLRFGNKSEIVLEKILKNFEGELIDIASEVVDVKNKS